MAEMCGSHPHSSAQELVSEHAQLKSRLCTSKHHNMYTQLHSLQVVLENFVCKTQTYAWSFLYYAVECGSQQVYLREVVLLRNCWKK